jgi:hypothetical protein
MIRAEIRVALKSERAELHYLSYVKLREAGAFSYVLTVTSSLFAASSDGP